MSMDNTSLPGAGGQPPLAPPPAGGRMRGWVKGVFILSLGLNFLVLGAVVGEVISHKRAAARPPTMERGVEDTLGFGPLAGAFDRDDRAAMRRAAEGRGTDIAALRQAMQADFSRLDAALRAEPFDAAALRTVLAEMRSRSLQRMDLGEAVMLARLEAMTPEARAAFADRLRKGVERFERRLNARKEDRRDWHD